MELRKRYVVASHNIAASILQQNSSFDKNGFVN